MQDPIQSEQVIWEQAVSENGLRLMAYDGQPEKAWKAGENAFYLSVRGDDSDKVAGCWKKLRHGAAIAPPFAMVGTLRDAAGLVRDHLDPGRDDRASRCLTAGTAAG